MVGSKKLTVKKEKIERTDSLWQMFLPVVTELSSTFAYYVDNFINRRLIPELWSVF